MWRRIVSFFSHHECARSSARLEAAFQQSLASQARAKQAVEGVEHASDVHRARISAEGVRIRARSATTRRARSQPPTSDVRVLVEEVLLHPGLSGTPGKKGRQ